MSLLWEHIDIFLGKVRGVQQFYKFSPTSYGLYISDYVYVEDKVTMFKSATDPEVGARER